MIKLTFHRDFFQHAQLPFRNNSHLRRNLSSSLSLFLFLRSQFPSPLVTSQAGWKPEDHSRCFLFPRIIMVSTFYLNISLLFFLFLLLSFADFWGVSVFLISKLTCLSLAFSLASHTLKYVCHQVVFDINCKSEFIALLIKLMNFLKERMFLQNGSFQLVKFLVCLSFIYTL